LPVARGKNSHCSSSGPNRMNRSLAAADT